MKNSKKVLWASRHPLDAEAESCIPAYGYELECKEVLWPSNRSECFNLAVKLMDEYRLVCGVFPAQAIEAFSVFQGTSRVMAPVNEPVLEPDTNKVRGFKFVRWAYIA